MTRMPVLYRKVWLHYHTVRFAVQVVTTVSAAALFSYVILRTGG